MKTEGSHVLSHPAAQPQPSAVQRAVLNRHNQNRRAMSGSAAKPIRPQQQNPPPPRSHSMQTAPPLPTRSPHGQTTTGMADNKIQQRQQPPIQPRTHPQQPPSHAIPRSSVNVHPMTPRTPDGHRPSGNGNISTQPNYYPPEYQAHLEQLGMIK